MSLQFKLSLSLCLLLAILTGCNRSPIVEGQVAFDGKPVKLGAISFLPVDGKGPGCGAKIIDGRYHTEVTVGKKTVQISSTQAGGGPISAEKMEEAREKAMMDNSVKQKPAAVAPDFIPANAEGNNAQIEIAPGSQAFNFDLKRPATK